MRKLLLIFSALLIAASAVPAQDVKERQDRKARLEREIGILDQQLKENASRSSNALSKLTMARKKITVREALVHESDLKLIDFDRKINTKRTEIKRVNARLDTMTVYYDKLVRSAYKNRDPRIWYMYLLSGDSIGQMVRRYTYLRNLSSQMNGQAVRIREIKAELEKEKTELLALRAKAQKERDIRAGELRRLEDDKRQVQNLLNTLKKNKSKYQKQLADKRMQVDALNKEINRLIASEVKGGKSGKKAEVDVRLSGEFSSNMGKLPWPVQGVVVQSFGQHYHPVYKSVKLPFNNGVDIAVSKGSDVTAVFDGVVKQVIVMPGYSKCILVQHGEYFTFYCKLKTTSVKAGDKIKTGKKLGTVDTIGDETQLHFQLWKGKTPQNPENWLR